MADSGLSTTAKALLGVFILAFALLFVGSVYYHFVYRNRVHRRQAALKVHSLLPSPYDSRPMAQHRSRSSRSLFQFSSSELHRSTHSVAAPNGPNTTQMWEAAVNGSRLQGGRINNGTQLAALSLGRRESQLSEVLPVYSPPARRSVREDHGLPGYEEIMSNHANERRGADADDEGLGFAFGQARR